MLYSHYSLAPWDKKRWPNFSIRKLSCPHCGEYYHDEIMLDAIQSVRNELGKPLFVNSAHRCWWYNSIPRIGGAPLSQHKKMAFDLRIGKHDRQELKKACIKFGFRGFGHYFTFLHVDMGRPRWWASKGAKKLWNL